MKVLRTELHGREQQARYPSRFLPVRTHPGMQGWNCLVKGWTAAVMAWQVGHLPNRPAPSRHFFLVMQPPITALRRPTEVLKSRP